MITRRTLGRRLLAAGSGLALPGMLSLSHPAQAAGNNPPWLMPDEAAKHKRTWMAFGASRTIWGSSLLPKVRANLGLIASTIAEFEPVTLLARPNELGLARQYCGSEVQLLSAALDDIWMRDSGCVFVKNPQGQAAGLDFGFNGWGGKQACAQDKKVAALSSAAAGALAIKAGIIMEGGAIEVDGQGTAILTESCILNSNRNPGMSKATAEAKLMPLLGLKKIIWLPGIKGRDITDAHTDFYARFVRPGVVVAHYDSDPYSYDNAVTKKHLNLLRAAQDAQGRVLDVIQLTAPTQTRAGRNNPDFAAGYVNFYLVNGGLILPEFGDARADAIARSTLQDLLPQHEIVQLNIDAIAAGGGGIHCVTQQEPA
ncbi:agmatine deiminase [Paucibacter sp. KBW04]|uniref:agmatine deiminase family protein n=1 Tax=Paucibacter sp. KBW04 TaxID=2153361 RepID=UPI000F5866A4|nr:agmatine deiminase family protein [Paucibacter sp. KBW04]RQO62552.1 agmatine deiminase [Paucibacter sp. KBW04]